MRPIIVSTSIYSEHSLLLACLLDGRMDGRQFKRNMKMMRMTYARAHIPDNMQIDFNQIITLEYSCKSLYTNNLNETKFSRELSNVRVTQSNPIKSTQTTSFAPKTEMLTRFWLNFLFALLFYFVSDFRPADSCSICNVMAGLKRPEDLLYHQAHNITTTWIGQYFGYTFLCDTFL